MECPKCGLQQVAGLECPACGIVFAKFLGTPSPSEVPTKSAASNDHTWKGAWFPDEDNAPTSPLRLVTLLLLLAIVTIAAYLEYSRHTEAFGIAEETVLGSEEIRTLLGADRGDELRVGYFFRGQARGRGTAGHGRFLLRVVGPRGEGSALVHLNRRAGRWQAVQVDFLGPRGESRSLEVQKPKARAPRAVPEAVLPAAPPAASPTAPQVHKEQDPL